MSTVANFRNSQIASRDSQAESRGSMIDPHTLMRIKSLQMRARLVMEGFFSGIHRSPYHGFSVEFSEYREYTPGDDLRYLDWKLFARSDRYYVKQFEDETNLRCTILLDTSRSMTFGSGDHNKHEYARTAAATIAYFLTMQRDAIGLVTFEDQVVDYLPPRHRPGHMRRIMATLSREPQGKATDIAGPLEEVAATVRKRGLIVIISDLLAPPELLATRLGYLRSCGHDVIVFRVLDPVEVSFDFKSPAIFRDVESGKELYIDAEVARADYQKRFQAHAQQIETACQDLGVDIHSLTTDQPLEFVLFELLRARMRRGRDQGRRNAGSRGK